MQPDELKNEIEMLVGILASQSGVNSAVFYLRAVAAILEQEANIEEDDGA